MPRAPRGKRVPDAESGSFQVVGSASRGDALPYFARSRKVWVAALDETRRQDWAADQTDQGPREASRDRHIADAADAENLGPLAEGFTADTTVAELAQWWLHTISRHRVWVTTWTTYEKQLRLLGDGSAACPSASSDRSRWRPSRRTWSRLALSRGPAMCGCCSCRSSTRRSI